MLSTEIVVLGMHRSGTSLTAAMLHEHLGVPMGSRFRVPDRWNRTGYYEDLDFRDFDEKLIHEAGGDWVRPPSPEALERIYPVFRTAATALVDRKQRSLNVWGWKSPRSCLTIKLYWPMLQNPRIVWVMRKPEAAIRSLMKREFQKGRNTDLDYKYWEGLCNHYELQVTEFLADITSPELLVLHYEQIVGPNGSDAIARLADFVGADPSRVSKAHSMVDQR